MRDNLCWVVLAGFAVGCAAGTTDPAEQQALVVQITETPTELSIIGLSAGQQVGEALVKLGTFDVPEFDQPQDGLMLSVQVGDHRADHISAGHDLLVLPMLPDQAINQFLLQPQVSAALARWKVTLDTNTPAPVTTTAAPANGAEEPYWNCSGYTEVDGSGGSSCGPCTYAAQPSCGATQCNQWPGKLEQGQFVQCSAISQLVQRACKGTPGSCAGGSTSCGGVGSNCCAACWGLQYDCNVLLSGDTGSACSYALYGPEY